MDTLGAQIGQRGKLIALEKALEIPVVRQGENRRVVGQEGRHHAQRSVLLGNPAFGFRKHIVKL